MTTTCTNNKHKLWIAVVAIMVVAMSIGLTLPSVINPPVQEVIEEQVKKDIDSTIKNFTTLSASLNFPDDDFTRRPILFSHFHKSGGSSVCQTMKKYSNITTRITNAQGDEIETRNCNAPYSGPKFNVTEYQQFQSCENLTPLTTDEQGRPFHRTNFLAVEVPYADEFPCPGFRSFAIMRHPVSRLVSHMTFHGWNETTIRKWSKEHTPNPTSTYIEGYPIVNCMVIRELLGRKRYRNVQPVNQDDLERAKKRVDMFHAFVPLEYLHHVNVSRLLNDTIPEYYQALQVTNVTAKHQEKRRQPSDSFIHRITEENKFDIFLYQYMLQKLGIVV